MSTTPPDPVESAREEAAAIAAMPREQLQWPVDRALGDCPFIDRASLLAGVEAFHVERMQRIPGETTWPEAKPWVAFTLARDRKLQALTGMSTLQLAIRRSLDHYLSFRGYGGARRVTTEKCRIVYLPDSDEGQFHIKNVDDPITFWRPLPDPVPRFPEPLPLNWDGVGSGMHMDDEPAEIFPLPCQPMCMANCGDVPGAVQFLTRYSPFWGGMNIVLFDRQKRSVAIEKCSYNHVEVFHAGPGGGSHCSGMACRDPASPQGRHQARKRAAYLQRFGQPPDGPDMTYWRACDRAERMLGDLMQAAEPTVARIVALFTTQWPDGLNKAGAKLHPDQAHGEYTLYTHAELYDKRRVCFWQRDAAGAYPGEPEVFQF